MTDSPARLVSSLLSSNSLFLDAGYAAFVHERRYRLRLNHRFARMGMARSSVKLMNTTTETIRDMSET